MSEELVKYSAGFLNKGIKVTQGNIHDQLVPDLDCVNLTSGINTGMGPRQGLAPLAGHSDFEVPSGAQSEAPGMMRAEFASVNFGADPQGATNQRFRCYGIFPFRMGGPAAAINTSGTYYATLNTVYNGLYANRELLGCSFLGRSSDPFLHTTNFADGLIGAPLDESYNLLTTYAVELIGSATYDKKPDILANLLDITGQFYVSAFPFSVAGPSLPVPWLYGSNSGKTNGSATNGPVLGLEFATVNLGGTNLFGHVNCGVPPEYAFQNYKKNARSVTIYGIVNGAVSVIYTVSYTPSSSIYLPKYIVQDTANYNPQGQTTVRSGSPPAGNYANMNTALLNDPDSVCDSSYRGILIAANKAIMVIVQDWLRGSSGELPQYVDPVNMPMEPRNNATVNYDEDGTAIQSCFAKFPAFVRGTALPTNSGIICLGGANTGVLRANAVYEFAYSIYNKRLNFETNVGKPVKFQVGADDNNSLIIFHPGSSDSVVHSTISSSNSPIIPWPGDLASPSPGLYMPQPDLMFHINFQEYRFYYRQEGMLEWLPALFIEAPRYWFLKVLSFVACTGGNGAGIGGRVGGVVDYSRLPDDRYNCAVVFRNRAFWLSDKAIQFSRQNNFFAYPTNNSIACPTGNFKGALLHTYYGQAEQSGRLVVCGSTQMYIGRFTGQLLQASVAVSDTTTTAVVDIPDSDFVLDTWTSSVAFSYRAMVNAKGILHWWGPDGVFVDNGTDTPDKISWDLEPDLATLYDPSVTDAIHTIYNDRTKEIWWFYAPRVADGFDTHALVYDVRTQQFLQAKFPFIIDASNIVNVETAMKTAGARVIVYVRAHNNTSGGSPSAGRPYYFDHRNRAGDHSVNLEMMVKTIATPSAGIRRLTMASTPLNVMATIVAGDYITIQQGLDYASSLAACTDMIAKVVAVNTGARTVDILLPTGAALDAAATLAQSQFLPIWHGTADGGPGINGFPWVLSTHYWQPGGPNMSMMWLYLYLRFQTALLKYTDKTKIALQYRTPVSDGLITDNIYLQDNSDGNYQLYHANRLVGRSIEGQAMRWVLSGNHIGHAWVLQWLEAHGNQQIFNFLKEFED